MGDYAIGVDLGGTNLRVAAVDEDGSMLIKDELKTEVSRGRDEVIDALCSAAQQVVREMQARAGSGKLLGIGVGVPGLIDIESGRLLESPNLPGWSDYDVKGAIERRLGTTVILENDANVAALGELWLGAGRGVESLCMYTLGTGVGGGLVLEGKIWRGWNGMAGELGHCNVEPEGHGCGCGSWGCLEQYASATAVVRMAREMMAAGAPTNSQAVYERAMQGDAEAKKVFERVGRALGMAIADMVNILNLSLYVIGGGVSSAWDAFAPAMFAEVRKRSFVYAGTTAENGGGAGATGNASLPAAGISGRKRVTQIRRAVLGGDGGLYGAARLAMIEAGARKES
ncbi:MAG: ROK family protein [Candidatus Korobacteraceae bacterium]